MGMDHVGKPTTPITWIHIKYITRLSKQRGRKPNACVGAYYLMWRAIKPYHVATIFVRLLIAAGDYVYTLTRYCYIHHPRGQILSLYI